MKKTILSLCIISMPFSMAMSHAAEKDSSSKPGQSKYAITAKVGTLGAGLDLTYKLSPKFNTRFNINGASGDYDETEDGVKYTGELDLFTVGVLLDYHPFDNGFRLSGGLYNNQNEIKALSESPSQAEIGSVTYDIDGRLNSDVSFNKSAPYLGLGWGNAVKGFKNFHFSMDVGVLFQGTPKSSLRGQGTAVSSTDNTVIDISNDPVFLENLAQEESNLNEDLRDFKHYPVISLGVSYNF